MQNSSDMQVNNIAEAIRRYLNKYPDVIATAEEVSNNWLNSERLELPTEQVQAALDLLVNTADLMKHQSPDGKVIYKRPDSSND